MIRICVKINALANHSQLAAMYICVCHAVTESDVRRAAASGVSTVAQLTMATGVGSGCGSCLAFAFETLENARLAQSFPLQLLQQAA